MSKLPLTGGAYQARSLIANAQRCINLYPEINPDDAPFPTTHYPTSGLRLIAAPPVAGAARGLYTATNGRLYAVIGGSVYLINSVYQWTLLGAITNLSTPVSMVDNGVTLILVDGTSAGYKIDLASNAFSTITDAAFYGSVHAEYLDTFLIFARPGTGQFYYSNSNAVTFNPLAIATKTGFPDPLVTHIVMHREIWLFGTRTTEIWYDSGASDFAFQIMPGVFIEHGCIAPYSVARQDLNVFWLSQDREGNAIILMGVSYQAKRISTHAIEAAIQAYSSVSDAIGFTYQKGGHIFYVLNFPRGDATWVYDLSTQLWHQRASADSDGVLHRAIPNAHANAYGQNLVLDYSNGNLYAYDDTVFTDNGAAVPRIRSFPHIKDSDRRIQYKNLIADFECGNEPGALTSSPVPVSIRWSDDGGFTYSNAIEQDIGSGGQYRRSVKWSRLGMGRDRVFELSWSGNVKTALNGAFIEIQECAS